MASEYLKWKYRNVEKETERELTPAEKRRNWWDYHKWHVVIGVIILILLLDLLKGVLRIGEIQPDVQVAYVGEERLPDDTVAALESYLASLTTDGNGDGRVAVRVNQYSTFQGETLDPNFAAAEQVKIMGDLEMRESFLFLLEDPESFQRSYEILCRYDGTLFDEGETDWDGCWFAWSDCPALADAELGEYTTIVITQPVTGSNQERLSGLYLARRGFWNEDTAKNPESCELLWQTLLDSAGIS